jgi:hypothetical protein
MFFHSHKDLRSSVNASATGKLLFDICCSSSRIRLVSLADVTLAPATRSGKKNNAGDRFVVFMASAVVAIITST